MKKAFLITLLLFLGKSYAQDSIVNYLDFKGNVTKKSKSFSVETIVKKSGFWQYTAYYRNGKIKEKGQYNNKRKEIPTGTFYTFSREGNLSEIKTFTTEGNLSGKFTSWFDTKKTDTEGIYKDGLKTGIWKYYHYNGILGTKQYYSAGKLMKTVFYNEAGEKLQADLIEFQKPSFNGGGIQDFWERIRDIHNRIRFQINGLIVINFDIDVYGNVVNVTSSDKIPSQLERRLRDYFKNIKGWTPAIVMNRKVPYSYSIPLDFSMKFIDR